MSFQQNMAEARDIFFAESRELLDSLEDTLLRLEAEPANSETLNALFRVAHTIKGSAGLFELHRIVGFTHILESVLDRARSGKLVIDRVMTALLLQCRDHIGCLLAEVSEPEVSEALLEANSARGDELVACLAASLQEPPQAPEAAPAQTESGGDLLADVAHAEDAALQAAPQGDAECYWRIAMACGSELFRSGMDPLAIVRYLATLGRIVSIQTRCEGMPAGVEMDPETCYLAFDIVLDADCERSEIVEAFDFVRDDCTLQIQPPARRAAASIAQIQALPEEPMLLGEMLVKSGSLSAQELAAGLAQQQDKNGGLRAPLGEILHAQGTVPAPVLNAALDKQQRVKEHQQQECMFIRVRADKLDKLINQVGELVVAGAGISLRAQRNGDLGLSEAAQSLSQLVEQIRDDALQLRMVPIAETFRRFNRVVRDTSDELGKDIALRIEGADNELDKSMVEKLTDPLMHLVRNSIDHGIEQPAVRVAAGKAAQGELVLAARHESGSFVIEVRDDGAGLNRERILAKAIEQGLATAGRELSDAEVWQFIFAPGFSTAAALSNLSGRGVGMDVVRRNIQSLRGSIEVFSEAGKGSRFTIRLPLTLAIIDGFVVAVGRSQYVIPLDMIVECAELARDAAQATHHRSYINLRGEVLPFLRLRDIFGLPAVADVHESIVVVQYGAQRAGLVVDELLGEFQTVIKPLSRLFQKLRGIAGSTILGDGEVALILDVPALVQRSRELEQSATSMHELESG